jgi:hypothetical protein
MSEVKAKYVGHPDGIDDFRVPVGTDGEERRISLTYGQELPMEIDGLKVPASFRDRLFEQPDNWTKVQRATGQQATGKTSTTATADEKEA